MKGFWRRPPGIPPSCRNAPAVRLVDVTVGSGQTNIMTDVSQRPMGVLHSPDHGQDAPIEDKKV